jgi:uncharacterized protein involved in exopolysaccharide biosynthesis
MDDSQSATPASELSAQTDEVEAADAEEAGEALSSKIARFLRTCWVRRWMVIGILVAGILVSLLYAFHLPAVYTSTTTLMPPDSTSPDFSIMDALSSNPATRLGSEALGLYTPGDLFTSILGSRNVQDGLINRFDLAHYYKTRLIEDTRKSLAADTNIVVDQKSGVITISVTAKNPVLASNLARGYVEELNRVMTENSTSAARRERIFLEERVKDVKQKLDESAKELSQFSAKSGAIDMASQTKSMVEEGLRLQAELIDGRSQLAALRQTYSEDNLRVRALEAHNAELQQQLNKMGGLPQGSGANADTTKSPYPTADELPTLGLTYYDLEREMRVEEALWETLTRQYEAAKVEEAEELPTVRVLDVAGIPGRKSGPSQRLIVESGALFSLVVALIAVLVGMIWEAMDPQDEPKRGLTEIIDGALNSRRWYWKLPGMGWIHGRLKGSEGPG